MVFNLLDSDVSEGGTTPMQFGLENMLAAYRKNFGKVSSGSNRNMPLEIAELSNEHSGSELSVDEEAKNDIVLNKEYATVSFGMPYPTTSKQGNN
jgi:hypothetical protein